MINLSEILQKMIIKSADDIGRNLTYDGENRKSDGKRAANQKTVWLFTPVPETAPTPPKFSEKRQFF